MVTVKFDKILEEIRESDFPSDGVRASNVVIALNESLSGISNEFGPIPFPATIVVDNDGEIVLI